MKPSPVKPKDIDQYIAGFPQEVQNILQKVRMTIKKAAPDAEETISYGMPTFTLHGHYLIYFAGYKKHIGMYPVPAGNAEFREEVSVYQTGKGTLQFSFDKPIPFGLITRIVKHRVKENSARAKGKPKK